MGRKAGSQVIDGKTYNVSQLSPRKAQQVLVKLAKLLGQPISGVIGSSISGDKKVLKKKADKWIEETLPKLFDRLDEEEVEGVVDTLLSSVNKTLDSAEFQGKLMHMYQVVWACAEVNYGDFFAEVAAVLGRLGELAATMQGNSTSTGSSGDQSSKESLPSKRLKATGA